MGSAAVDVGEENIQQVRRCDRKCYCKDSAVPGKLIAIWATHIFTGALLESDAIVPRQCDERAGLYRWIILAASGVLILSLCYWHSADLHEYNSRRGEQSASVVSPVARWQCDSRNSPERQRPTTKYLKAAIAASPVILAASPETPGLERVPENDWICWADPDPVPLCKTTETPNEGDHYENDIRELLEKSLVDHLQGLDAEQQKKVAQRIEELCTLVSSERRWDMDPNGLEMLADDDFLDSINTVVDELGVAVESTKEEAMTPSDQQVQEEMAAQAKRKRKRLKLDDKELLRLFNVAQEEAQHEADWRGIAHPVQRSISEPPALLAKPRQKGVGESLLLCSTVDTCGGNEEQVEVIGLVSQALAAQAESFQPPSSIDLDDEGGTCSPPAAVHIHDQSKKDSKTSL